MKVIGTVGHNGAGKDAIIEYLQKRCGIPTISIGDIVREIAKYRGVNPTRENLHRISQEYRDRYGKDVFAQKVVERLKSVQQDVVAIAGIRTPEDIRVLRQHFEENFLLVHVEVHDPHIRYERLQQRDKSRDPDTYEEFLRQDRSEKETFNIDETIAAADMTLNNDGTLEQLHKQIEDILITKELADFIDCK